MQQYMSDNLSLPCSLLDIQAGLEDVENKVKVVEPEFANVMGMALMYLHHGRNAPLNIRRGAYAYQGDFQVYRGQITRLAVGVAVVFALAIVGATVLYSMVSADEKRLNSGFCEATRRIVGREICDPTAALATLRQAPGTAEGMAIPRYSAATLLEFMSRALDESVDVNFDDMEIRVDGVAGEADRISAKGDTNSFEAVDEVAAKLKRDPCVQKAEISQQRRGRDPERVEFRLDVSVQCPAGRLPGSDLQVANAGEPTP